jgi:serine protease Do
LLSGRNSSTVSAVNRVAPVSITNESRWDDIAQALRHVTVQIFGTAGNHGAGVVWRSDGLIVTNAHVVNGISMVRLQDGRSYRAELIRKDLQTDLALLLIPVRGLAAAKLRDARTLRIGEMVVAVGHPRGEAGAVSLGMVHRSSRGNMVEADIRLAPGNSGGPLADASGKVVGINCMVAHGMGVAIATTAVEQFVQPSVVAKESG